MTTSTSSNVTVSQLNLSQLDYEINTVPNFNSIKRKRPMVSSIESIGSDINSDSNIAAAASTKLEKDRLVFTSTNTPTDITNSDGEKLDDSTDDSIVMDTTTDAEEAQTETDGTETTGWIFLLQPVMRQSSPNHNHKAMMKVFRYNCSVIL